MILNQEYESLGLGNLLGERGHARTLFGKVEEIKVAGEISKLQPFLRSPTRDPITYDFEVIGLWETPASVTFCDLIRNKKKIYKEYRSP